MRLLINSFSKILRWPIVLAYYAVVLFCVSSPIQGDYVFLGIAPSLVKGSVNYISFSRWMLMMSTPILLNGYFLDRSSQIEVFAHLRMKSRLKWNFYILGGCAINTSLWVFALCAVTLFKIKTNYVIYLIFVLWPNFLLWTIIATAVYFLCKKAAWSSIMVIAFIGGAFLLGEYIPTICKYVPSTWGMLYRSTLYWDGGYLLTYMIIMNLLLCVISVGVYSYIVHTREI